MMVESDLWTVWIQNSSFEITSSRNPFKWQKMAIFLKSIDCWSFSRTRTMLKIRKNQRKNISHSQNLKIFPWRSRDLRRKIVRSVRTTVGVLWINLQNAQMMADSKPEKREMTAWETIVWTPVNFFSNLKLNKSKKFNKLRNFFATTRQGQQAALARLLRGHDA